MSLLIILFVFNQIIYFVASLEVQPFTDIKNCKNKEYYNYETFQCALCNSTKHLIPADNRLSCVCNEKSIMETTAASALLKCTLCPNNTMPTLDQRQCIACVRTDSNQKKSEKCKYCKNNEIAIEKDVNGTYLNQVQCVSCGNGSVPDKDQKYCVPCTIQNGGGEQSCTCPNKTIQVDDTCVPNGLVYDLSRSGFDFDVEVKSSPAGRAESIWLRQFLPSVLYLCKFQLKISTACQSLANLCTLTMYDYNLKSACQLWYNNQIASKLPWLFYGDGDAPLVLNRRKINVQYTFYSYLRTSWLNISSVPYFLNGSFSEINNINWYLAKYCDDYTKFGHSGFRFGIDFQTSCSISYYKLLENEEILFHNPYLLFEESGELFLYALPVLIQNMRNNRKEDNMNWLFVRRFFFIDNFLQNEKDRTKYVRYIKSMEIRVNVRDRSEGGKIYPPFVIIDYDDIDKANLHESTTVPFTFAIKFSMEGSTLRGIEISIGILSALAVLYSGIQTWTHSRRSGRQSLDISAFFKLFIYLCANLSNAFFVVAIGVSIHSFIFFKAQSVIYLLLPNKHIETMLLNFIIVAFSLKIAEIVALVSNQISIDIFLIDWEKPRPLNILKTTNGTTGSSPKTNIGSSQQPVSIWRTYFIANEWNEIQAQRKINVTLHLIIVGFILEILGVKYWTATDTELKLNEKSSNESPLHYSCLLAVGFLVFVCVYSVQFLFVTLIYERYIKNRIQDFVDVCSLANISVFILQLERFGFYIHGRSAHGFADTDMLSMFSQLQREENNLCGHRGLVPETEEQTFRVAIPATFRNYYRKLMGSLINSSQTYRLPTIASLKLKENLTNTNMEKSIQAYNNINRFLIAFFEHALKDLDYEVRSPLFLETLLDIEFSDQVDRGVLYTDNGHSFDNVLFYGNEFTLITFDLMLFIFVAMLSCNFLLAVFVTGICYQIIYMIRRIGGRKNLARKTLIDERFLI